VTYGFLDGATAALFGGGDAALRVQNPIASDLDQMRPTPIASLAQAAARNAARGWPDVALSEVGGAYAPGAQQALACALRAGGTPPHWDAPARPVTAMDAKADAMAVLEALGGAMQGLTITEEAPAHYHPGRSATLKAGRTVLAQFGELHPRLRDTLGLPPAVACEVFLDAIPDPRRRRKSQPDMPAFQPVRRDFAFLADAGVAADALLRAARGAERALITDVALFDRYAGDRVPEGKVSLAIQVTLQPRERTLTDAEIEAVAQKVVAAVAKATGAVLR
jgi:phenylalanyl-tRNA synthetase beta chain